MKAVWLIVTMIFIFYFLQGGAQSVSTPERSITKVSDNVYVIRHKDAPDGNPQGNTTVIVGKQKVVVVDAPYLPSSASEDIKDIRKWTKNPVNYLINTHWHADHQQSNAIYLKEFPGLIIIAHQETGKEMRGFEQQDLERYKQNYLLVKREAETGTTDSGTKINANDLKNVKEVYRGQDSVMRELTGYIPSYPNLLISSDLYLKDAVEPVEIKYLGPVHTKGDIIVYLPKQKLLVTGDIVVSPVPYFFGGGFPYSGLSVLEYIDRNIGFTTLVPGHGVVMHNKTYLKQEIQLLKYVTTRVQKEIYKQGLSGLKVENIKKAIDLSAYRKMFAKGNKDNEVFFDESIGSGLIEGCVYQIGK